MGLCGATSLAAAILAFLGCMIGQLAGEPVPYGYAMFTVLNGTLPGLPIGSDAALDVSWNGDWIMGVTFTRVLPPDNRISVGATGYVSYRLAGDNLTVRVSHASKPYGTGTLLRVGDPSHNCADTELPLTADGASTILGSVWVNVCFQIPNF
jgi:hypothetical protein